MSAHDPVPPVPLEPTRTPPVSNPLRPTELLLVGLGGAAGSMARYAAGLIVPGPGGTLIVNVFGAFLLGLLVETVLRLTARSPEDSERALRLRRWRLLLGTGVLGGFTTYSLLAADVAEFLISGRILEGAGYGLATVVCGGVASVLGILAGRSLTGRGESEARS